MHMQSVDIVPHIKYFHAELLLRRTFEAANHPAAEPWISLLSKVGSSCVSPLLLSRALMKAAATSSLVGLNLIFRYSKTEVGFWGNDSWHTTIGVGYGRGGQWGETPRTQCGGWYYAGVESARTREQFHDFISLSLFYSSITQCGGWRSGWEALK